MSTLAEVIGGKPIKRMGKEGLCLSYS